jgi:hypothetical protein
MLPWSLNHCWSKDGTGFVGSDVGLLPVEDSPGALGTEDAAGLVFVTLL